MQTAFKSGSRPLARAFTKRDLIFLAIALSLCVYWFFLMLPQVEHRSLDDNISNQYLFGHMSQHYAIIDTNLAAEFPAWQPRVASQLLSGMVLDQVCALSPGMKTWNGYHFGSGAVAFGIYQAGWLALTCLVVWRARPDAIFVMLMTYAGMTYNLTIPSGSWFYPWDMPSLCLFTWAYLAWEAGSDREFVAAAFLACVFKETGAALCLFPLLNRRWVLAAAVAVAGYLMRAWLMQQAGVHTIALPWNNATGVADFFAKFFLQVEMNVIELLRFHLNSFFFTGCGLVVLFFFLQAKWQTKAVAGFFIAGQFSFGFAHEFREWGELLPLTACVACDNLFAGKENPFRPKNEMETDGAEAGLKNN